MDMQDVLLALQHDSFIMLFVSLRIVIGLVFLRLVFAARRVV